MRKDVNCYKHRGTEAVAICHYGCGRFLCSGCANLYDLPTCEQCAGRVTAGQAAAVSDTRRRLVAKIAVNLLFLAPYIAIFRHQPNPEPLLWPIVPMLLWGFIGFRWLTEALQSVLGIAIISSLSHWSVTYLFGSLFVGMLGFLVIPVLVLIQVVQLLRFEHEARRGG